MDLDTDHGWPDSLWHKTAEPLADLPTLRGVTETRVGVIGAGYTGLSTALHLAESGTDTVVIDAKQPGWGCSGRNGGQVNPNWKVLPEKIRRFYDAAEFGNVMRVVNGTCDLVFELIEKYDIQCHAVRPGYVLGVVGQKGMHFVHTWFKQWEVVDANVELLDRSSISSLVCTDVYDGGMLDRRGGSLQPLSYARGLARACLDNGVAIYGDTPALSVSRSGGGWRIETPYGAVDCAVLVIGANGYTDACWPGLQQTIVPVASLITATEPLPEDVANGILPERNAVSESGGVPSYYRLDEDNRMVFGGRGTFDGRVGDLDTRALRAKAERLYPSLREVKWEFDWGGYVAMTTHHRPMLLRLADGAFSGLGYNGRGVAMATMMGKQLAMAARGEPPELPIERPKTIPFHSLRNVGIAARILGGHVMDAFTRRVG